YSFLNSSLSPEAIVALAKRHGLPAIAMTDAGNLHGAVEFAQAAKAAGIKPIFGAEIQVDGKPLWLYVQNAQGYANLCRILSRLDRRANDSSVRTADDPASKGRLKIAHGFNRGTHTTEEQSPEGAIESNENLLSPLRGLMLSDTITQGLRPGLSSAAPSG